MTDPAPPLSPRAELLWHPTCPNVDAARGALRAAFAELGLAPRWIELRQDDPELPARARGFASPTVLVDGCDVAPAAAVAGEGCRVYAGAEGLVGAPPVAAIVAALRRARPAAGGELVLVRHGETVGESSIRLYGATDIDLSAHGELQMRRAAAALAGERFTALVTSPMLRARRSAALVAEALDPAPPLRVIEALRERDFGAWEGWTVDEVAARDPEGYRRWQEGGLGFTFPGGEPRQSVIDRVGAAIRGAEAPLFPGDQRTLAVLHKGIIKVVLGALLGLEYSDFAGIPVALGSIHRLSFESGAWSLRERNLIEHLGDAYIES